MFREFIEVIKENNQQQISNSVNNANEVKSKLGEYKTELTYSQQCSTSITPENIRG